MVGRMGVEEAAPADERRRASAGDADLHRAWRAGASGDLETHIHDILNVIKYEDLRDIVLIGHSYGGMVATGVADRARKRIAQLIYLDAFVPNDGESAFDLLPEATRAQRQAGASGGADGWRMPPGPMPPDTSPA